MHDCVAYIHIAAIYYLLKTKMKYISTKLLISPETSNDVHVDNWGNGWVFTGYELYSQEHFMSYILALYFKVIEVSGKFYLRNL